MIYPSALNMEFHRVFGKHSKIPKCCVENFVYMLRDPRRRERYDKKHEPLRGNYKYVPCPKCIQNKRIEKIHHCCPGCGLEQLGMDPKWVHQIQYGR